MYVFGYLKLSVYINATHKHPFSTIIFDQFGLASKNVRETKSHRERIDQLMEMTEKIP